jgi:hypothetical protein
MLPVMRTKRRINFYYGVLIASGIIIIASGCSGNRQSKGKESEQQQMIRDGWISLFDGESLSGWEITNFGTEGPVQVSGGNIILGMGDGCTGITWKEEFPEMNYEIQLDAKKISGNDFFCGLTFPVGDSFCSFIVGGWGGPVVGLSTIDGYDASENETNLLKKFDPDTWYHIRLKVTPEKIEAWIDEEQVINFLTANRKLSIRPEVELSRPFGVCSWMTTAALKNIGLKCEN